MLPYGPLTALIVAAATSPSRAALAPAAAGPTASPAPSWDFETTVAATATTTAAGDPVPVPTATTTTTTTAAAATIAAPADVDPTAEAAAAATPAVDVGTASTVVATTTTTTAPSTTAPAEVGTATASTATSAPDVPGSAAAAPDDDDVGSIDEDAPASSSPSRSRSPSPVSETSVAIDGIGRFCGATMVDAILNCDHPCDEECGPEEYCFPVPLEMCGGPAAAVSTTSPQSGDISTSTAATASTTAARPSGYAGDRYCGPSWVAASRSCSDPCPNGLDAECLVPGERCFDYTGCSPSPVPTTEFPTFSPTTAPSTVSSDGAAVTPATTISTTSPQSGDGSTSTAATTTSTTVTQPLGYAGDRYCGPSWLAASRSCSDPCPNNLDAECLVPGERCFDHTGCSPSPVPTTELPTFSPTLSPSIFSPVTAPDDGAAVTVSGSVFWDADGDGLRDEAAGAAPTVLAGVVVDLYTCVRNNDSRPGTRLLGTRTDAAGRYAFASPLASSGDDRENLAPALDRWGVTRFRAVFVLPGPAGRYAFGPGWGDSDVESHDGWTACWDLDVDGRGAVAWDAGITNAASQRPTLSPTTASPTASAPPSRRYDGDNYCGENWVWASRTCSIPCPGGEDSECPDGEGCFYFTGCSSEPFPTFLPTSSPTTAGPAASAPPSRRYDGGNYCGANWAGASGACSIPCPGGEDSECPRGEACYYFTGCSLGGAKEGPSCEPIDCKNGLFNLEECACQCIPPYCPYPADGTCTLPSNDCDTNPWRDCVMGEGGNCPWWVKSRWPAGECTSGPELPPDIWDIYGTLDECCDDNFESSDTCKSSSGPEPICDIPTSGCTNGMFNQALCQCECIRPFCPDANGDCLVPTDNCGGNKWADCVRGVNCPWWVDPLRAESCSTGPDIPLGLWQIYNTEASCCNTNFPYSNRCVTNLTSIRPTRHPTIAAPGSGSPTEWPTYFPSTAFPVPDPFNSTSTRGPSNDTNATLTKSVEPTTAKHNGPSKKPALSPDNPQQNAPALPRIGDWYPDYDSDICKNDGLQYPFEINFFETYETCCEFDLIDTEKCLEARKNANEGDDELNLDFSGCFATRQTAMLSILSLLVMTLSWL